MNKPHVWLHGSFLEELLIENRTYSELQIYNNLFQGFCSSLTNLLLGKGIG